MKYLKLILVISVITFNCCKKNNTGGFAIVNINSTHHGKKIPFTKVYIKYGAKEFPGLNTNTYNSSQTSDLEAITSFKGLRYGDYYFYGIGYDSAVQAFVRGGIGVSINWKQRKNEVNMELPITE